MSPTRLTRLAPLFLTLISSPALAQYSPAPTAYTAVQIYYPPAGPPVTMTTYRDGQVVVAEHLGPAIHAWTYFDLAKGKTFNWSTTDSQCSSGTVAGDWGDPFQTSEVTAMLSKLHPRDAGTEIVNGIRTNALVAYDPEQRANIRVWRDVVYGEPIKVVVTEVDKKVDTPMMEVKSITVGKPALASLALPPSCAKVANQPTPQTEAARIAALTGSAEGMYVAAPKPPASKEACAVQFSVAQSKSMAVVTSGFRVGVDPNIDTDHPASYVIGEAGKPFFSGGGLREVSGQLQNGVVKLPSPSAIFDMELSFDNTGTFATARIYRQCFGKSTAKLLYVISNPAKLSEGGEWLWSK